jgi:hypothetical protein
MLPSFDGCKLTEARKLTGDKCRVNPRQRKKNMRYSSVVYWCVARDAVESTRVWGAKEKGAWKYYRSGSCAAAKKLA